MTLSAPLLRPGDRVLLACLPGTLCDGRAFEPLIAALQMRGLSVRAVTVDTAAAQSAAEVARLAADRLMPGPGEVLVIAGFSLGGIVAAHLAGAVHCDVGALLLLDMNGEADRPDNAGNRRAMVDRARKNGLARFIIDETWPTHVAAARLGDLALRDAIVAMALSVGIEGFARQAEIAISRPRTIDILAGLDIPTLVLWGEEDRITPRPLAVDIAAATRGRLLTIADAGHFAVLERPDTIADTVLDWLAGADPDRRQAVASASGQI